MTESTKTARKPANVKFVALRKVCTSDGETVQKGETGEDTREVVQAWMDKNIVQVALPE